MRSVVIYDSQYGNTRAVAEAIAAELHAAGAVEVVSARTGTVELRSDLRLLVVGGPTQAHGMTRPLRTNWTRSSVRASVE
jgi:flavodoxin